MLFSQDREFYAAKMSLVLISWQQPSCQNASPGNGRIQTASITNLAREAGLSPSYIFHLLGKRIDDPSHKRLTSIALAVGFDSGWWQQPLVVGPPVCHKATI